MKKFYLMVALSLMPILTANAQGKEYCELIGTQHITKFSVAIDSRISGFLMTRWSMKKVNLSRSIQW